MCLSNPLFPVSLFRLHLFLFIQKNLLFLFVFIRSRRLENASQSLSISFLYFTLNSSGRENIFIPINKFSFLIRNGNGMWFFVTPMGWSKCFWSLIESILCFVRTFDKYYAISIMKRQSKYWTVVCEVN